MTDAHEADRADGADLLHREMRVRRAPLPSGPEETVFDADGFALAEDRFQFVTPGGARFHYVRGAGLTVDLPGPSAEEEFQIYLWGTVFGAVAWLNGYFPLHASAVALGGNAIGFTGESGAGKSTLAAGLAAQGLPHVADDTLPLALDSHAIWAVPDGKPVKLWAASVELLGSPQTETIASMPHKFYTRPPRQADRALPLAHLISLEDGVNTTLEPVRGSAAIEVFAQAMYRPFVPSHIGDHAAHARWLLALANHVGVWRLRRPRTMTSRSEFDAQVDELRRLIERACR